MNKLLFRVRSDDDREKTANISLYPSLPMKKKLIFHPLIIAVFPPMTLYLQNVGKLSFAEASINLVTILIALALFWLMLSRWVKNKHRAAAITSIFFMLFFAFGHIMPALANFLNWALGVDRQIVVRLESFWGLLILLVIWATLFWGVTSLIIHASGDFKTITQLLNVMSVVLAATTLYRYVSFAVSQNALHTETLALDYQGPVSLSENPVRQMGEGDKPDIYYIILDGYARADILQDIYDWDNHNFLSELERRGFYIATDSHSNYGVTLFSLASSLNLTYLDVVTEQLPSDFTNPLPMFNMIQNNWLFPHMEDLGYTTVGFSTGYSSTEMKDADIYLEPSITFSAFQNELLNMTPLRLLFLRQQYDSHRDKALFALEHLRTTPQDIAGPKFVFAHIILPHPPFVLGADGTYLYPKTKFVLNDGNYLTEWIGYDLYIESYRAQVAFVSREILSVLDDILAQSATPPIIILQADHGSGAKLDWGSFENTYFPERFSILNAYRFPNADYDALYESITPVNTFRIILDQYFGEAYGLLEDKSFFSLVEYRPYAFVDVTDRLISP
jgi:hypothetical protein